MSYNNSTTSSETPPAVLGSEATFSFILRYFLYAVMMFISLIGNSAVCYVTYKEKRMRSFAYVLIANLAASDVLATLCVPWFLIYVYNGIWTFGDAMCKLLNPSVTVFAIVTTNTLVATAFDRYRAVVFPFKLRPSTSETRMIVVLIWMLALLFSLPSYGSRIIIPPGYCVEQFTTDPDLQQSLERAYGIFMFLVNNLIPLLLILGLHTKITLTLKNVSLLPQSLLMRTSSLAGRRDTPSRRISRDSVKLKNANAAAAKKREQMEGKFIRMLLVVVILFVTCYVPYHVLFLITSYRPEIYDNSPILIYYLTRYFYLLIWCPCALNPLLYAALNERYARSFTRLFCRSFVKLKRLSTRTDGSYNAPNATMVTMRRKSSPPRRHSPSGTFIGSPNGVSRNILSSPIP